jgi:hypothetical protein
LNTLKKTRQHRLAGDARDAERFRHERIAPQMGNLGELARITQQAAHKGQCFSKRPQPAPKQVAARVQGMLLVGEADGLCFVVGFAPWLRRDYSMAT